MPLSSLQQKHCRLNFKSVQECAKPLLNSKLTGSVLRIWLWRSETNVEQVNIHHLRGRRGSLSFIIPAGRELEK